MILEVILLLTAIPAGFLIAWLARDELIQGRKWFKALIIISFLISIFFLFTDYKEITLTTAYLLIISLISLTKSRDKKWVLHKLK